MNNSAEGDDDWAELARELERDNLQLQPPVSESESEFDEGGFAESGADGEDGLSDDLDDAPDGAAESDTEPGPDGQPGTGRKRRRRRRRRRKSGQPADGTAAPNDDSDEQDEAELAPALAAPEVFASDEEEYQDEGELEVTVSGQDEVDEDAGGELLRELIANWNVPSWDVVVGGLYRPDR